METTEPLQKQAPLFEQFKELVFASVSKPIEDMAFLEVVPADRSEFDIKEFDWLATTWLYAEILIHDPFPAELRLIMPRPLVAIMASNLYVIDQVELTDLQLNDFMAETVNMMAGNLMALLAPQALFKLGLPELGEQAFLQTGAFSLAFDFEAGGFFFWLVLVGDEFVNLDLSNIIIPGKA